MTRLGAVCLGVLFSVAGCATRDVSKSVLSEGCLLNTDCTAPLVCAFRRCHQACESDRDCPLGARCRAADRPFNVCLLDDEAVCGVDGAPSNARCPAPLACAGDLECRDRCVADGDCVAGQACVKGFCAAKHELTPDGGLKLAPGATTNATGVACVRNSDCPAPLACVSGQCARQCVDDRDCPFGSLCEEVNGRCSAATPDGGPLDAGPQPDAGAAGARCNTTVDCGPGLVCGAQGRCGAECTAPSHCATGCCQAGRCAAAPVCAGDAGAVDAGAEPDAGSAGASCNTNVDCGPGLICGARGRCAPECTAPSHCATGCCQAGRCAAALVCVADGGAVDAGPQPDAGSAGASCNTTVDCGPGLICGARGLCAPECLVGGHCATGCCQAGRCAAALTCAADAGAVDAGGTPDAGAFGATCNTTADCEAGLVCGAQGRCGFECAVGAHCASGCCQANRCAAAQVCASDAGAPVDAGVDAGWGDAGPPPTALVSPQRLVFPPSAGTQRLNGSGSSGAQPLSYRWTQLDGGPRVDVTPASGLFAAQPSFTVPATPGLLSYELVVTDAYGRPSPPAVQEVLVARAPVAVVTVVGFPPLDGGAVTVGGGALLSLSAAASTDSNPLPITQAQWRQVGGPAGVFDTSPALPDTTFRVPSVSVRTLVALELVVTNSVGLASAPAPLLLAVEPAASLPWTLDAGTGFNVSGGTVVTLRAVASAPGLPGATFSYDWQPRSGPGFVLTAGDTATASFIAPTVEGAAQALTFTVTATTDAGVVPAAQSASVTVSVLDATRPSVTRVGAAGRTSRYAVEVEFSEPVLPLNTSQYESAIELRDAFNALVGCYAIVRGRQVTLVPFSPLREGEQYRVVVPGVNGSNLIDLIGRNLVLPSSTTVLASTRLSPRVVSADLDPAVEPRPALALRAPFHGLPDGGLPQVQLVGRGAAGAPWVSAAFDPAACALTECPVASDTLPAPSQPLVGTAPVPSRRGGWSPSGPVVLLRQQDFVDSPRSVGYRFDAVAGAWSELPAPTGPLVGDPLNVFSLQLDQGLRVQRLDGGAFVPHGVLSTDTVNYPMSGVPVWSAATSRDGAVKALAVRRNGATSFGFFSSSAGGAWSTLNAGLAPPAGLTLVELRVALSGPPVQASALMVARSPGTGAYTAHVTGQVGNWSIHTAPVTGLSALSADYVHGLGVYHLFAFAVDGVLRLYEAPPGTSNFTQSFAQPLNDGACTASSPELEYYGLKVLVTWQERCGAGPWRVVARLID